MIRVGDVYCYWCRDEFEPEGIPSFDEPNFCSEDCESAHMKQEADLDAYAAARFGAGPVF